MLICPKCGNGTSSVIDTRINKKDQSIRRRRQCDACGERFSTNEVWIVRWRNLSRISEKLNKVTEALKTALKILEERNW